MTIVPSIPKPRSRWPAPPDALASGALCSCPPSGPKSGPSADHVLTEDATAQPTDAYGRSKLAAEQGLAELALDWVALRLVLVYGAGVTGNMAELVRLARTPYPLPLGALRNRRSLLSLDNLVAAIDTACSRGQDSCDGRLSCLTRRR